MGAPRLPKFDHIEPVPAGEGWTAHVMFRAQEIVGVVVTPNDPDQTPHRLDLRDVKIGEARTQALVNVEGLTEAEARERVREARRKFLRGKHRGFEQKQLYWLVAHAVLAAQTLGEPRYSHVRKVLSGAYDLGPAKKQEQVVKDLIRRATEAGYLEPAGSGRGPRVAGPRLAEETMVADKVTIHPDRVTITPAKAARRKASARKGAKS